MPLNTRLPASQQRRQAELAGTDAVVDSPLDGFEAAVEERRELERDALHCVLFTSGTTGDPKPVPLTVGNQDAAAAASAAALGSNADDRWLCPLPLFHIAGLAILVRCARSATTAVLHERFDVGRVKRALEGGEATLVSLVPAQLQRLRAAGLEDAPGLRAMLLGGGPVPPDLLEWATLQGLPARCTYGMTESASQVVVTDVGETAGRPLPGAEIQIAPDGEILLRGDMVARSAVAADGWLHTNDIGYIDAHGRLHVEGRMDDLIVTGGEKVAPGAVEAVLLAHPAVADAAVAGLPDEDWGEAVTAFVVERRPVADYDLLAFCREYLAGYQVPKRVLRVEALPRNAAGKLRRADLAGLR